MVYATALFSETQDDARSHNDEFEVACSTLVMGEVMTETALHNAMQQDSKAERQ